MYWLAYAVGAYAAVAMPGHSFPHYFQLWLPILCIGAGWTAGDYENEPVIDPAIIGGLVSAVVILVATQMPAYFSEPNEWSLKKYGPIFIQTETLAKNLNTMLRPGEEFFQFGNEPGLYFYSNRRPPSGVLFNYPLTEGPATRELSRRVAAELEVSRPELLVLENRTRTVVTPDHPLYQWMSHRYVLISSGTTEVPFSLFALRGGALEGRLKDVLSR
jgi:hypothetical protein